MAQRIRIALIDDALTVLRGGDGTIEFFGQGVKFGSGIGPNGATTRKQNGTFGASRLTAAGRFGIGKVNF